MAKREVGLILSRFGRQDSNSSKAFQWPLAHGVGRYAAEVREGGIPLAVTATGNVHCQPQSFFALASLSGSSGEGRCRRTALTSAHHDGLPVERATGGSLAALALGQG